MSIHYVLGIVPRYTQEYGKDYYSLYLNNYTEF